MVLKYSEVLSGRGSGVKVCVEEVLKNVELEIKAARNTWKQERDENQQKIEKLQKEMKVQLDELILLQKENKELKLNTADRVNCTEMGVLKLKEDNANLNAQIVDKSNMVRFLYNKVQAVDEGSIDTI